MSFNSQRLSIIWYVIFQLSFNVPLQHCICINFTLTLRKSCQLHHNHSTGSQMVLGSCPCDGIRSLQPQFYISSLGSLVCETLPTSCCMQHSHTPRWARHSVTYKKKKRKKKKSFLASSYVKETWYIQKFKLIKFGWYVWNLSYLVGYENYIILLRLAICMSTYSHYLLQKKMKWRK